MHHSSLAAIVPFSWSNLKSVSFLVNFFYKAHLTFNPSYLYISCSLDHAKLVFFSNSGTMPFPLLRYCLTIVSPTLVNKLITEVANDENILLRPIYMTNLFNILVIFFTSFSRRCHLDQVKINEKRFYVICITNYT